MERKFSIMKNYPKFLCLSLAIILIGAVFLIVNKGFVTDIDFSGGTMMRIDMENPYEESALSSAIEQTIGEKPYSIQKVGDANEVIVKMKSLETAARDEVFQKIKTDFNLTSEQPLESNNISAAISSEILTGAIMAVIVACILMLIYITIRFEFTSGVAAVIALIHDTLLMISFYAIFRIPVNASFIAAILTIIGYSINATIVIFDRVRENRKYLKKEGFSEVCEKSILQTLRRSINSSGTTFVTLVVLYVLGSESIRGFALPLMVGVIVGTYSSIFIAAPTWNMLRGNKGGTKKKAA
ncbi:MAG: protein translocase subunit SecF [Clostridia bacterium]|nr:protein translocase subunit SecF [Clostridia bacterium]